MSSGTGIYPKKDIPWSYVIHTWRDHDWVRWISISQCVKLKHVAITPTLTVEEEKETTIPMHWPAAFARLFACFTYSIHSEYLWINGLIQKQVLFQVWTMFIPHESIFASHFFAPKSLVYIYIHKQAVKSLRTNVFQEWDRGGDRPAPWEFGLFHSWRLARSFGFRVLANRWFLVSTLGLNWREGSVCVDARLRSFKVFWL